MALKLADVQTQYNEDKNLKKEDVRALMDWAEKQPHLPKISELQAIIFLHSCYYSNEAAKTTIDNFFTLKTTESDIFQNRDILSTPMQKITDICLMTVLPKKTPEGYNIFLLKIVDSNTEKFIPIAAAKFFDMVTMLPLHQEGISNGFVIAFDFNNVTLSHLLRVSPMIVKKILYYLQEAFPLRLKGLHFFNTVSFMDRVLALIKPFMKKELLDMLYLHETVDDLVKFIPRECLPEDYGGKAEPIEIIKKKVLNKLVANKEFFEWEETCLVDESKRQQKRQNGYGIEGTFKKLELD